MTVCLSGSTSMGVSSCLYLCISVNLLFISFCWIEMEKTNITDIQRKSNAGKNAQALMLRDRLIQTHTKTMKDMAGSMSILKLCLFHIFLLIVLINVEEHIEITSKVCQYDVSSVSNRCLFDTKHNIRIKCQCVFIHHCYLRYRVNSDSISISCRQYSFIHSLAA